jgi:Zn-finger nucleic acid-binding protein
VGEAELQERVRIVRSKNELALALVFDPSYLASGAQPQRPCPQCREPLEHRFLGDIQVDRCGRKHGIWFDAGELQTVLEASAQGVAVIGQDRRGSGSSVDAGGVVDDVGLLAEIAAFIAGLFD